MKRIFALTICMQLSMGFALTCHSQEAVKGRHNISAGYGFLPIEIRNDYYDGVNNRSISYFGPVYFKYEHFFEYNLSLGISYAHAVYKFNYEIANYNNSTYTYTYFIQTETHVSQSFLARLNYHILEYQEKFMWDPYVGVGLGYRETSYKTLYPVNGNYYYYYSEDLYTIDSRFGMEATFGVRCFLTPGFAIYAEGGMAKSAFQLGTTFSF